jgi:hypothetical protein
MGFDSGGAGMGGMGGVGMGGRPGQGMGVAAPGKTPKTPLKTLDFFDYLVPNTVFLTYFRTTYGVQHMCLLY